MFGLNDNEDAKKDEVSADAALAAPYASEPPGMGATAVDSGAGPIMPTSPVVTPTEPPPPIAAPDMSAPKIGPIEAIPTPPAPLNPSAPPLADATMPEDSDLGSTYGSDDSKSSQDKQDKKKTHSSDSPASPSILGGGSADEDLMKLKTEALKNLAPLVDKLDQSPEEKFKTTMMLIQASDNSELVPEAYEAANKIDDEKARAQALLDVVNEINYFTQHEKSEDEK